MTGLPQSVQDFDQDIAAIARIGAVPTILEVVSRTTGMGFAVVARVTEDRWIACGVRDEIAFGLKPGGELKIDTTICNEIRDSGKAVVIDHVAEDEAFRRHPTPAMYGFQSYISMPIRRKDGSFFGTLCAFDPRPAKLKRPEIVGMFELFADLIGFHLDTEERPVISEKALDGERALAEMREQFIAVLGHDLRNPLASIDAGLKLLRKTPLDEKANSIADAMQNSVDRMAKLIENVLDLARGRLDGGLAVTRSAVDIEPLLMQAIEELRLTWPDRTIKAEFAVEGRVTCDGTRVAQLFSNLLANALTHGSADEPVTVRARGDGKHFELSVANGGEPVPADMIGRLFEPFFRGSSRAEHQGLGLGLFIAQQIARAHEGTLTAQSDETETRFTFRMPLG